MSHRRAGTTGASRRQVAGSAHKNFWRCRDRWGSPCGRTPPEVLVRPNGHPSPELDPAQLRWKSLLSNDAVASFEESSEKRERQFQIVPVRPHPCQRRYAPPYCPRSFSSHRLTPSCLISRLETPNFATAQPICITLPTSPRHSQSEPHEWHPRADCGRGVVGRVWDDRRPGRGDAPCFQFAE
jgi:hypothetical protein